MKTEIRNGEHSTVILDITVEQERVFKAYDKIISDSVRFVSVPGFRKGKAPRKLAEKELNLEKVKNQATEDLATEVLREVVKEKNISPVAPPDIDVKSFDPESDFSFTAVFEVYPEFELGDYSTFEIEVEKPELQDSSVQKAYDNLRDQYATFETIDEDRAAEKSDYVVVSFTGTVDGTVNKNACAEDMVINLAEDRFIPGFLEAIIGMKKGEIKDVNLKFPENYEPSLKGKDVNFKIELKELQRKVYPEFDDQFVKEHFQFETVDALRADIARRMQENIDNRAKAQAENKISTKLSELVNAEIPESMVLSELQKILDKMAADYSHYGVDIFKNLTDEQFNEFAESKKPEALARVKTDLALDKIVELENLTISDDELENQIATIAATMNEDVKKFRQKIKKSNSILSLKALLLRDKALNYVCSISAVNYVLPKQEEKKEEEQVAAE